MTGVSILLIISGGTLLYSAFKQIDPRSLFTSVLTGSSVTPLPPIPGTDASGSAITIPGTSPTNPSGAPSGTSRITPAIRKVEAALGRAFPGWRNGGDRVCKYIQGTSTPSQHAWGNAVDVMVPTVTGSAMGTSLGDKVAQWAIQQAQSGALPIDQVIWRGQEWIHGGSVYDHFNHVHLTGSPQLSGIPPCMSGGGGTKK
jgi:hypothetical protein